MTRQHQTRTCAIVVAAIAMLAAAPPATAQNQSFGNPDLPCPHGQWLRPNFYTTFPEGTGFFAQDRALCDTLRPDIYGLGCHGLPGGVLGWDTPCGGRVRAPADFGPLFCSSPGVKSSNGGFAFMCRAADPGVGRMSCTEIAKEAARTGKGVVGPTAELIVGRNGNLTVCDLGGGRVLTAGPGPYGTARSGLCGNYDSFINANSYLDRNTGMCSALDCEFVVTPADELWRWHLTANANTGTTTCGHLDRGRIPPQPIDYARLPGYGANRRGVGGVECGEFLRPKGWMNEAPMCRPGGMGWVGTGVCLAPALWVMSWELENQYRGTPYAKAPPDVLIAMALDPYGTCLGNALEAASIPMRCLKLQHHHNQQDFYYGNGLPAPPGLRINGGTYCQQRESWEVYQMLSGNRTVNGNGCIVPRSALRAPGPCGGGNVRSNNVDPPYQPGDADQDLGGCAATKPGGGAAGLALVAGALLAVRRRRR